MKVATCIGCGCNDNHACDDGFGDGCSWLKVDRRAGVGVCSSCPGELKRWNRGERAAKKEPSKTDRPTRRA